MRTKKIMKRTRWSRAIIRLTAKPVLLLLLVTLYLSGRACNMAVIPNSNVNLATNIRDILNAAGGNVNDNTISFFQPTAKINKWSAHKPVPGAPPGVDVTDPYSNSEWFLGSNGKCGLDVYTTSNLSTLANYVLSHTVGERWKYILPKGGSSEPYRCGDFRGYWTDAIKPFSMLTKYSGVSLNERKHLLLFHNYDDRSPYTSLLPTMMRIDTYLSEWYLGGIFISGKDGSVIGCGCNQYPLGDERDWDYLFQTDQDPLRIPFVGLNHDFPSKVYNKVIPILSKKKHNFFFRQIDVGSGDLFCDLPVENSTLYFYNLSDVGFYINENTSYYDGSGIHIEIWGKNTLSENVNLGNFRMEIWVYDIDDQNLSFFKGVLVSPINYKLPANTIDHDTREGGYFTWGKYTYGGGFTISESEAYNAGYFIKLIGDDPDMFPEYTSRRIPQRR